MPSVVAIGTALPAYHYSLEEMAEVGARWLTGRPETEARFHRFLTSSHTLRRYFILPAEDILRYGGLQERAAMFEEYGPPLGAGSFRAALSVGGHDPAEVTTLVFTSCSCPVIPSIDALVLKEVGLSPTVMRLPIYQHGCAGGVVGLQVAAALSRTRGLVALTSVELCSLVFQRENPTGAQLVGAALFGDGAATALVTPEERGLVFRDALSYLIPHSRHLMGYDLLDDGFHLRLDRDLPHALAHAAPERVRLFLGANSLVPDQVAHWLFHPGGTKILDFLERAFALPPERCHWARGVLQSVGNLSSATVLYVLDAFLRSGVARHGDKIVMMGVGPGLTLELILFEWCVPDDGK